MINCVTETSLYLFFFFSCIVGTYFFVINIMTCVCGYISGVRLLILLIGIFFVRHYLRM